VTDQTRPGAPRLLASGAFADVFDLGDDTVIKVYRRTSHTADPPEDWSDHDFVTGLLCATEVAAYERLQSSAALLQHIPRFLGAVADSTVAGLKSSTGDPFVPGCAFRLERIRGCDIKIAPMNPPMQQEIELILEQIHDACKSINLWDCSCFIPGPRRRFVVIDFALWDHFAEVQYFLNEGRRISPDLRERLRSL
jgi:hypothetical protein